MLNSDYFAKDKMTCTWLYVLTDGECFYVGITYRLGRRMREHRKGRGSTHTSFDHKLVTAYKLYDYEKHDYDAENMLTLQMAKLEGCDVVIGGKYCQHDKSLEQDVSTLKPFQVCHCGLPVDVFKATSGKWFMKCSKNRLQFLDDCDWYKGDSIEPCTYFRHCGFSETQGCVSTYKKFDEWIEWKQKQDTQKQKKEEVQAQPPAQSQKQIRRIVSDTDEEVIIYGLQAFEGEYYY